MIAKELGAVHSTSNLEGELRAILLAVDTQREGKRPGI